MTITLSPEQEEIVAEAIRSGAYSSPGQVIGRALESLDLRPADLGKPDTVFQLVR